MRDPSSKIKKLSELLSILEAERPPTLVSTNGCFDLLHVGHLRTLVGARRLGDALLLALNSDDSVRRLKGPRRPLVNQQERAEMLAGLECVDYVVIFEEDTPLELLAAVRPDIHVKGGDYNLEELPETALLRSWGGTVKITPFVPGRSTTELERLLRSR